MLKQISDPTRRVGKLRWSDRRTTTCRCWGVRGAGLPRPQQQGVSGFQFGPLPHFVNPALAAKAGLEDLLRLPWFQPLPFPARCSARASPGAAPHSYGCGGGDGWGFRGANGGEVRLREVWLEGWTCQSSGKREEAFLGRQWNHWEGHLEERHEFNFIDRKSVV